jgi:hypothetical protein
MEKPSKRIDVDSLMSPPEPAPYDNFVHALSSSAAVASAPAAQKPPMPMSPPVSPFTKPTLPVDLPSTPSSTAIQDPILYPTPDGANSSGTPPPPLFAPAELSEHRRIVDEHVATRSAHLFRDSSPPQRQDYELALYFQCQVMRRFSENPNGWLRKERGWVREDNKRLAQRRKHGHGGRFPVILPAKSAQVKAPRPHKVVKPSVVATSSTASRSIRTNPAPQRQVLQQSARSRVSATPEPRRIVAPNREDKDFVSLPNFCPPRETLPPRANSLKVDWKGAPIDLSGDPNAHLLHPDELSLAANLRLDCATYLTSKRRIFIRRLECARTGKEFRKTDAQQACKIDVNKASKLWTAFEKVGWLNIDWMRDHLRGTGSEHVARN